MTDYKDPEFRKSIVKAVNNDKLIIFVGAGISRLCGLPSWDEASNRLLEYCVSHCRNFTYANKERIIANVKDAKEKITIGYYLLKKEDDSDALYQTWLKNEFSLDASSKDKNFSRKQVRMRSLIRGLSSIVFSTNVDLLLDKDIPYENRFFTKEQLQNICIKEKTDQQIWHLHGSLDRSRDIIFTTRQYLERYADPRFRDNLYNLLNRGEYTILFIGYGLSELQLLDFLVNAKGDGTRMFLLQPYFSDDGPLYEAEAPYYMDYGITLIKYPKDHGYDELFQVLADLKKEVNDSSSKTTKIYSNLEKVLREKPTESAECYIKRNFDCLTDDLKSNLMFSLRGKNDYSSQWLFFLCKQEEYSYLFDAFNDLPNSSSDDKEPFNIKNLRLLLNEFAEKKSEDLFSISKEKSKQLFKRFEKENDMFSNKPLVWTLIKLIFSDYHFLNEKESLGFLEKCSRQKESDLDWVSYADIDNNKTILIANKQSKKRIVKMIVRKRIESDKYEDYNFEKFFNSFGRELAHEIPNYVFDVCFTELKKIINKSKFSHYNIMGDCFEKYAKSQDVSLSSEDDIIKWLLVSIPSITEEKLITAFNSGIKSRHLFEKRLSIYLSNVRFSILRDTFFSRLESLSSISYYAELYSLISNNVKFFSDGELNQLYHFISSSSFDSKHSIRDIACKADLCKLLIERGPMFAQLRFAVLSKLSKEEVEALSSFTEPLERSKLARIGPVQTIEKDEKVLKAILNGTKDDFIRTCNNLKETQDEFDVLEVTIINSFQTIYEKLGLSSLEFATISSLPDFVINLFIDSFAKDPAITIERKLNLFHIFANDTSKQESLKWAFAVLNSLYFYLQNHNISGKEKENIVKSLLAFKPLYDSANWSFNKGDKFQTIFSTKPFFPMSMLLQFIDAKQWNVVRPLLEEKLLDVNANTIAKAISIFNLNTLLTFNPNWVESNLKIIFDNKVQNENLSFKLFSCSVSLCTSFVLSLAKNNILVPLLNSEEISHNSIVYLANLLVGLIQNVLPPELKPFIFQAKNLSNSFYYLIKETNRAFLQQHINEIIALLGESIPHIKQECTSLVVLLLQNSSSFKDSKTVLIPCALALSGNGFSGYYVNEVVAEFQKDTFTNQEKIEISSAITDHIKDCYFYYDDIIHLFDTIDWSNNKNRFNELQVKYRKIEPDLASELLEEYKKKYPVNKNR